MVDILRHPLIKQSYEVSLAIEECGASEKLTTAAVKSSALTLALDDFFTTPPLEMEEPLVFCVVCDPSELCLECANKDRAILSRRDKLPEVDPNEPQPPSPPPEVDEQFRKMAERIFFHVLIKGGEGNPFRSIRYGWFVDLAAPKLAELLAKAKYSQASELDADEHDAEFRRESNIKPCPACGKDPFQNPICEQAGADQPLDVSHEHHWIEKFRVTIPDESGIYWLDTDSGKIERGVPSTFSECGCGDALVAPASSCLLCGHQGQRAVIHEPSGQYVCFECRDAAAQPHGEPLDVEGAARICAEQVALGVASYMREAKVKLLQPQLAAALRSHLPQEKKEEL